MLKREQNTWGGVSDPLKGSKSKNKKLDRNKDTEEQKREKQQKDNIAKRQRLAAHADAYAKEGTRVCGSNVLQCHRSVI